MFCMKCGQSLPEEAEFCLKCGEDLRKVKKNIENLNDTTSSLENTPPPRKPESELLFQRKEPSFPENVPTTNPVNEKKKIGAIVFVALCAVGGLGFYLGTNKDVPKETATESSGVVGFSSENTQENMTPEAEPEKENEPIQVDPMELYGEILQTIATVANDTSFDFESIGLPYYFAWETDNLSNMGYDFLDVNGDGVPELFIDGGWGGNFVSCYTIIDGEVVSLVESGERYGYSLTSDLLFAGWGSGGAADNHAYLEKLNEKGEFEYLVYLNGALEDPNDWDSAYGDYDIPIENGQPNFENRRFATEEELDEFYQVYNHLYEFSYTPFTQNKEEPPAAPTSFSGEGRVTMDYFETHDEPYPASPTAAKAVWCHGANMESLCYYGGLDFLYSVEDNQLFITYPDCQYVFYFGYIVPANLKEGDYLLMDGSEIVLEVRALTEDGQKRLDVYFNNPNLLSHQEGYDLLNDWVTAMLPTSVGYLGTFAFPTERMINGAYEPFMNTEIKILPEEWLYVSANLRTKEMYIEIDGNPNIKIDDWYRQRFG